MTRPPTPKETQEFKDLILSNCLSRQQSMVPTSLSSILLFQVEYHPASAPCLQGPKLFLLQTGACRHHPHGPSSREPPLSSSWAVEGQLGAE